MDTENTENEACKVKCCDCKRLVHKTIAGDFLEATDQQRKKGHQGGKGAHFACRAGLADFTQTEASMSPLLAKFNEPRDCDRFINKNIPLSLEEIDRMDLIRFQQSWQEKQDKKMADTQERQDAKIEKRFWISLAISSLVTILAALMAVILSAIISLVISNYGIGFTLGAGEAVEETSE